MLNPRDVFSSEGPRGRGAEGRADMGAEGPRGRYGGPRGRGAESAATVRRTATWRLKPDSKKSVNGM